MADNDKKPFEFNQKTVDDKLEAVKANLSQYIGKPGYNPFLYKIKSVDPLLAKLADGDKSEELFNAIMKLNDNIVPNASGDYAKQNREQGCKEPQAAGASHNLGQIVKPGQS